MGTIRIVMIAFSIAVLGGGMRPGPTAAQMNPDHILTEALDMPEGIAIDSSGQLVVHSNGAARTLLTQFSSSAIPFAPVPLGSGPIDSVRFLGSRLDTDRTTDTLYLLSRNGDLLIIDPITLQEITRYDLRALRITSTHVYNFHKDASAPFALSPQAIYGDIAVYHSQTTRDRLALFLTGFSDNTPFVLRLQIDSGSDTITNAQVVLVSTVSSPNTLDTPRGIAVNSQGTVYTTLPSPTAPSADCPDVIVQFTREFPSSSAAPPQVINDSDGIPSWGMSVDEDDNIYATTGGAGNSACRDGGAGSVVFIPAGSDASDVSIHLITTFLPNTSARPQDVVVSPLRDRQVYLTISNFNTVLRLPALP